MHTHAYQITQHGKWKEEEGEKGGRGTRGIGGGRKKEEKRQREMVYLPQDINHLLGLLVKQTQLIHNKIEDINFKAFLGIGFISKTKEK